MPRTDTPRDHDLYITYSARYNLYIYIYVIAFRYINCTVFNTLLLICFSVQRWPHLSQPQLPVLVLLHWSNQKYLILQVGYLEYFFKAFWLHAFTMSCIWNTCQYICCAKNLWLVTSVNHWDATWFDIHLHAWCKCAPALLQSSLYRKKKWKTAGSVVNRGKIYMAWA